MENSLVTLSFAVQVETVTVKTKVVAVGMVAVELVLVEAVVGSLASHLVATAVDYQNYYSLFVAASSQIGCSIGVLSETVLSLSDSVGLFSVVFFVFELQVPERNQSEGFL